VILETTDGGVTWTIQLGDVGRLRSVFFVDESTGWIVGRWGTIFKTTTGGKPR
jgi:photosystem II stability/assembly factor-like uncharacterized protein